MNELQLVLIAAVDEDGGIGRNGLIPWDVPGDRAHFRDETSGHVCLFGRRTYESLGKRTLPNRIIGVLTHNQSFHISESEKPFLFCANSMATLLDEAARRSVERGAVYICGGAQVYAQTMEEARELVLSRIPGSFSCDSFFPRIPETFALCEEEDHLDFVVQRWRRRK